MPKVTAATSLTYFVRLQDIVWYKILYGTWHPVSPCVSKETCHCHLGDTFLKFGWPRHPFPWGSRWDPPQGVEFLYTKVQKAGRGGCRAHLLGAALSDSPSTTALLRLRATDFTHCCCRCFTEVSSLGKKYSCKSAPTAD